MRLPRSRTYIMEHPRESTVASVPTANARDSIGRSLDRVVRSSVRPSASRSRASPRAPSRPRPTHGATIIARRLHPSLSSIADRVFDTEPVFSPITPRARVGVFTRSIETKGRM